MSAEPVATNRLSPGVGKRSVMSGDVPEALARRYYTDGRGGELGFYVDAKVQAPVFRDRGHELVAVRADPNAIRDMIAIARHRDWTVVKAKGAADFRREAWLTGRAAGLEVRGYRPSERDLQELERLRLTEQRREVIQPDRIANPAVRERPAEAARANMQIIETVVRSRLIERSAQERILSAARERLVKLLDQGIRLRSLLPDRDARRRAAERAR
jgi:hypothetical protein